MGCVPVCVCLLYRIRSGTVGSPATPGKQWHAAHVSQRGGRACLVLALLFSWGLGWGPRFFFSFSFYEQRMWYLDGEILQMIFQTGAILQLGREYGTTWSWV